MVFMVEKQTVFFGGGNIFVVEKQSTKCLPTKQLP